MKRLLSLMLFFVSLVAAAQITYPYNPDGNADGQVAVSDMQDLLSNYSLPFAPGEIFVDSVTLGAYLDSLEQRVALLESIVSNFEGLIGCNVPLACNYNPSAPVSAWINCEFPEPGYSCEGDFVGYEIGQVLPQGIVFRTWNEGMNCSILSFHNSGEAIWGCIGIEVSTASELGSGNTNTQNMIAFDQEGNAAALATSAGDGWHLPSEMELSEAMQVLGEYNQEDHGNAWDSDLSFWKALRENLYWGAETEKMIAQFKSAVSYEDFGVLSERYWCSTGYPMSTGGGCTDVGCANYIRANNYYPTGSGELRDRVYNVRAVKDL